MIRVSLVVMMLLTAWAGPALAAIGTADNVPGSTLLIPYFEVDPTSTSGVTTLVAIHNTSASATMAHVVLWTDLGIPTLGFDVYLTGYDVQTINLRDILVGGYLPVTASDGQDPTDNISPQGPWSQDINFASCTGILPYPMPALTPPQVAHLQAWHSGQPSPTTGTCGGVNYGESILRGYLTADVTNQCTVQFPGDPGYFLQGGGGVAGNRNMIVGDWMIVDQLNNFMESDRAVAIEADATDPLTNGAGDYTFYGRLVSWSGADNREALPNLWGARYLSDASTYRVWRDPGVALDPAGFPCNLPFPAAFPLTEVEVMAFDTQENPTDLTGTRFPYAALEVAVDASGLPAPAKQGWMLLDLDSQVPIGTTPGVLRQSWVTVKQQHQGRFSASWSPVQLGTPAAPVNLQLPSGN